MTGIFQKRAAGLISLMVGIFFLLPGENRTYGRTFTQSARRGNLPVETIEPVLEIRHNLPEPLDRKLPEVAKVVRRCYAFVEGATGRDIDGGILLYILHYAQRPRAYRFQVEVPDDAPWNEIRVTFLETGESLLGEGGSRHLNTFLYDTLPHELGHDVLASRPTLRHDGHGQPPRGTRWFIEGTCEVLAKGFAHAENPTAWRRALARRRIQTLHRRPWQADLVFSWSPDNAPSAQDESDLYGWSYALVKNWTERYPLPDLLALMEERGGGVGGRDLELLLRETTGLELEQLLEQALGAVGTGPLSLRLAP